MPEFVQEQSFSSDKSSLTAGWRPAYLVLITVEPKPEGWLMRGDKMWRWHYAVWQEPQAVATTMPEHQSCTSSTTFSPGGKNPPSNAFKWTEQLLGRRPQPGERINLDPMMPLPCRVKVTRAKNDGTPIEYARIIDLEEWPEGREMLTDTLKAKLLAMAATWQAQTPSITPQPQASAPTVPQLLSQQRPPAW